jgi:hypothetical protein
MSEPVARDGIGVAVKDRRDCLATFFCRHCHGRSNLLRPRGEDNSLSCGT